MISALSVVTPPAVPAVDAATAAAHLRLDVADPLVPLYVAAATTWAENYTARAFISTQFAWTVSESPQPGVGWPMVPFQSNLLVLPQWWTPDLAAQRGLTLPRQPLISVDAASLTQFDGTVSALTSAQYAVNVAEARFRLLGGAPFQPNGSLAVTFTAGYGVAQAAVPLAIQHAILVLTAAYYEMRGDTDMDIPGAVRSLLNPYRLVTFG